MESRTHLSALERNDGRDMGASSRGVSRPIVDRLFAFWICDASPTDLEAGRLAHSGRWSARVKLNDPYTPELSINRHITHEGLLIEDFGPTPRSVLAKSREAEQCLLSGLTRDPRSKLLLSIHPSVPPQKCLPYSKP